MSWPPLAEHSSSTWIEHRSTVSRSSESGIGRESNGVWMTVSRISVRLTSGAKFVRRSDRRESDRASLSESDRICIQSTVIRLLVGQLICMVRRAIVTVACWWPMECALLENVVLWKNGAHAQSPRIVLCDSISHYFSGSFSSSLHIQNQLAIQGRSRMKPKQCFAFFVLKAKSYGKVKIRGKVTECAVKWYCRIFPSMGSSGRLVLHARLFVETWMQRE